MVIVPSAFASFSIITSVSTSLPFSSSINISGLFNIARHVSGGQISGLFNTIP